MRTDVTDSEARAALAAVERSRRHVVDEIDVPGWYWWGLALGWVAVGLVTDLGDAWRGLAATLVFGAVHASVAHLVIGGRRRTGQLSVRASVAGPRTPAVVVAALVGLAALTTALAVAADADGAEHPATMASLVVAVLVVLGGPRVMAAVRGPRPAGGAPAVTGARFDEIIHPSTRLSIVALLAAVDWVDFTFVRDRLELSDSALSKQFATLEDAGYIGIERPVRDRRRRVRVRLTDAGREAFRGHVAALREIVAASDVAISGDVATGDAPTPAQQVADR